MKHRIDDKLSFKNSCLTHFQLFFYLKTVQSWVQINTNSQTTEITDPADPLKVFDSFSVFVEPISYQRIFHLFLVLYITAHLVKY